MSKLTSLTLTPGDKRALLAFYRKPTTANPEVLDADLQSAEAKGLIENAFARRNWWQLTRLGRQVAAELTERGLIERRDFRFAIQDGGPEHFLAAAQPTSFWNADTLVEVGC